jgi:hypothetical protein
MDDPKTITARVRAILLKEWDPIGVGHEPRAQDEYDSYAPQIAGMVLRDMSKAELAALLLTIEHDLMGLPGNEARAIAVAGRLSALA